EHPSFADNPALGDPPAKSDGTPRACDFGDNPLTPAVDVFACNRKLIGGETFLDTYNSMVATPEVYPTTRDSNGHGTHTASTAAGDIVASAPIFGIDRGPISGVAPGAWLIEYKVCGLQGCYGTDTAAAVEQAIIDGVNVINFSISGGANPYTDATELAFLDAYNAGILVAASAGNAGPGAGTTDHHAPWVMTVAASTQTREFQSTLTVTSGTESATFAGSSLTTGVTTPAPIVRAEDIPGYDALCSTPLAAGAATGTIVACQRGGNGRVEKGFNLAQGGAAGMILYNATLADTETDNHFLPAIHLADGTAFLAFLAAHPTSTGSFTDGVKADGQGDVMAAFSSRGPGGLFLKPDITAPGVQILAGNTPTPDEAASGPAGQYFQAIAGTSMSAPHIAGSAVLLKALHPDWSPGAIKSAMMTTANTSVVKEDLVTPADPFDDGAGRVDLTMAGSAQVVFDESASRMFELGNDDIAGLDLNLPSINIPTMPGAVQVHRTATNVSNTTFRFKVSTTTPAGATMQVFPKQGRIRPGQSLTFDINVVSTAPQGQYFGQILLDSSTGPDLHLPVAFFKQQGAVSLAQDCQPLSIAVGASTTCTVSATNTSFAPATVTLGSLTPNGLLITKADGASVGWWRHSAITAETTLAPQKDAVPAIAPIDPAATPGGGYLPLAGFGIAAVPIGDDQSLNFNVPGFVIGGTTYTSIGVVSNGYIVLGGAQGQSDINFLPQTFPDLARPNGVLAPYWTDLDGTGRPGARVGLLSDGASRWLVVEFDVGIFGDPTPAGDRNMQVWIGLNGVEDITYSYDANALKDAPPAAGLTVGAENDSGTAGAQISGPPTTSYVVTTTPGAPGGSLTYALTVRGTTRGVHTLASGMLADLVPGGTIITTDITVTRR
ncbi:MAG: S8 family serine peptidase, partial [Ilumatobacteraceae bacterium]